MVAQVRQEAVPVRWTALQSSVVITLPNVLKGSALHAFINYNNGGGTDPITSISDSSGQTLANSKWAILNANTGHANVQTADLVAVNVAKSAGTYSLTVNLTFNSGYGEIMLKEITGVAPSPLDGNISKFQSGVTAISTSGGTGTASNANFPALLSSYSISVFSNTTIVSGDTVGLSSQGNTPPGVTASGTQYLSGAGANVATFTGGTVADCYSSFVIFDEATSTTIPPGFQATTASSPSIADFSLAEQSTPNVVNGDIFMDSIVTTPGNYTNTVRADGTVLFNAAGDTSRQMIQRYIYRTASSTLDGPQTTWINSHPPVWTGSLNISGLPLNVPFPTVHLANPTSPVNAVSPDGDPIAWSVESGALPPGLSVNPTTGDIDGVPTVAGDYTFVVGATDTTLALTLSPSFLISIGLSLIIVPNLFLLTPAIANQTLSNANLAVGSVGNAYSDTVPAGEIMAQSPQNPTQVPAHTLVNYTVSQGPQSTPPPPPAPPSGVSIVSSVTPQPVPPIQFTQTYDGEKTRRLSDQVGQIAGTTQRMAAAMSTILPAGGKPGQILQIQPDGSVAWVTP